MIDLVKKEQCTGCKMCADICPKHAIEFENNYEGFWYPKVNEDKCIKCGACFNHCPIVNKSLKEDFAQEAYAAWNRDDEIRRESTSGGLYYAFAKHILDCGGYIVGSVYSDDYCSAYHTWSDNYDGLSRIMGSKYFQSDTEGIYKKTKELLSKQNFVLFTGTPCQVAALKNYLNKEYENLITVDFICRGVPSPKMQANKIHLYEKNERSRVVYYRDKSDIYAWSDFGELIKFENGKQKFISRWEDEINNCFIHQNLNIRESCYSCELRNGDNVSELTIGDFWGIAGVTEKDTKLGVSALMVNNQKGKNFVSQLDELIYLERRNIDEVKKGNPVYVKPAKRPKNRKQFFDIVDKEDLETAVNYFTDKSLRLKLLTKKKLLKVKFRKWIPIFKIGEQISWIKFIKYNYFSKNVIRDADAFIIPCHGTELQLAKNAKLILHGNLLLNYYPCYKRGTYTTLLKIGTNAMLTVNNRMEIAYSNTISIDEGAKLESGYFFTGIGANVICHHDIMIGNNVMAGRDVCIFDSDYHPIYNENGVRINPDKKVIIEDNSWIGARSMVLKGAHIHRGAIISANSMVMGDVEENKVFINKREPKSVGGNIIWER